MKIGILTYPLSSNYGGILQNYALQQVLKSMGHEVYTIDWFDDKGYSSFVTHLVRWIGRCAKRYILHNEVPVAWNTQISEEVVSSMTQYLKDFISNNISTTRRVHVSGLYEIDFEYQFDVYIVGSDQVWNLNCMPTSFLSFVNRDGVKKIFYAASGGNKLWVEDGNMIKTCKNLVESFCAVSVREHYLQGISNRYLGINASLVLDPTLLLEKQFYFALADANRVNDGRYVFAYWLDSDSNKKEIANCLGARLGAKVIDSGVPYLYGINISDNEEYAIIPPI